MDLLLASIISLTASVLGGIFAGWLVLRKSEYDLKQVYAHQIYVDFSMCFDTTFLNLRKLLQNVEPEVLKDIHTDIAELSKEETAYLREKYIATDIDLDSKVALCSRESIILLLSHSLKQLEYDFNDFF